MSEKPQPKPKPKLRWYQYRLWHLFLVTLIFALWLGWICHKANQQRRAVDAIEDSGGRVFYDYQVDANDVYMPDAQPPGPAWFRSLVGIDFLADVVECTANADPFAPGITRPQLADGWVEQHVTPLTRLNRLTLSSTGVTDTGLVHLKGLPRLNGLWLNDTQVTDEGVEQLQQALPNCRIYHTSRRPQQGY